MHILVQFWNHLRNFETKRLRLKVLFNRNLHFSLVGFLHSSSFDYVLLCFIRIFGTYFSITFIDSTAF